MQNDQNRNPAPSVRETRALHDPKIYGVFESFIANNQHKREYEIGEKCWFHADDYAGTVPTLTSGVIVCWLKLDGMPDIQYIIRPDDPKYTHMEVRDWRIMTPDPNKLPAIWPPAFYVQAPLKNKTT